MPNTYTQLYVHYVFAVKCRAALIQPPWQTRLHEYITGIFQHHNHKMIQVNSMYDHIHILTSVDPSQSLSSIIQQVKTASSKWINQNEFCPQRFAWQEGYAAFSYSKSQLPSVVLYIQNQQVHHEKHSFLQEYRQLLQSFDIKYDDRYIFHELV